MVSYSVSAIPLVLLVMTEKRVVSVTVSNNNSVEEVMLLVPPQVLYQLILGPVDLVFVSYSE